jgi:hypothetical protein
VPEEQQSLVVSFAGAAGSSCVALRCLGRSPLPSERAAAEILAILDARRDEEERRETEELTRLHAGGDPRSAGIAEMLAHIDTVDGHMAIDIAATSTYSTTRFRPRSSAGPSEDELLDKLAAIEEAFGPDDLFELHEARTAKVNFDIENHTADRAEDVSVTVTVASHGGRLEVVLEQPCERPEHEPQAPTTGPAQTGGRDYPRVDRSADVYVVTEALGHLEAGSCSPAFRTPLRVILSNELAGTRIPFTVEVAAKNLSQPVVCVLHVDATLDDTAD